MAIVLAGPFGCRKLPGAPVTVGAPGHRGFVPVDVGRSLWGKLPVKGAKAEATIKAAGPV